MTIKSLPKNNLISKLSNLSHKYPRIEKILLVPNYQNGLQILENLSRAGTAWINFRPATVTSLAMEVVEDVVISEQLEFLSLGGVQVVVDSVFNRLADSGKLKYFEKHPVNKGIVEALTKTVRELRLHGILSGNLKSGCFINESKGNDIRLILSGFEKVLEEKGLIDNAGLVAMALERVKKGIDRRERKYFICSRYYMRGIEKEFVQSLCGGDPVVINEDPVIGIDPPRDIWSTKKIDEPRKCEVDVERLRWLFNSKKAPPPFGDGTIDIFHAVGHRNEVREVLRRISAGNVSADDVEVICTDMESYGDLFFSTCEKLNIPVTFSGGIGSYMTNAGRTLMGFLLWIREDFNEIYLRRILESGGVQLEAKPGVDMPGSSTLGLLLRTSGVGWGRERYSLMMGKNIEECKNNISRLRKEGEEDAALYQENKVKNLDILKSVCEDFLHFVPEKGNKGKIGFGALCQGCLDFTEKHVRMLSERDSAFVEIARERFRMLGRLIEAEMDFDEAIEKLVNAVSGIRVGASGPKPGHLHVSHYKNGGKSGREATFVVGLDESKFPEKSVQDPVLLDGEREKMAGGLELSADRLGRSIYDMAAVMAGLRGRVTVSYSSYGIKEDRKMFPAALVLQVFRVKEGRPEADYNDLFKALEEPVWFSGSAVELDETDWWLNRLVEERVLKDGTESLKKHYPGVKEGLTARKARESNVLTEYDGKITPYKNEFDPRENKDLVVSCSQLEGAAGCPFSYFIKNILKVKKPDETEKDITAWLDGAERGLLLHEVFQKYAGRVRGEKGPLDQDKKKKLIKMILDDTVKDYKEAIPPPGEIVFQNEYNQLKRDVNVFLQINQQLGTEPVYCELVFGDKKENAVAVRLADGREILLRGKVDRVDTAGESEYHVWDYKTGSSYNYEEGEYVKGGEQIQHSLYAAAVEAILRAKDKKARVTSSGYLSPTEKGTKDGKGGIFPRPTGDKSKWQGALGKLLDIIAGGSFMVNNKDSACIFCDYADVCGGEKARDRVKMKMDEGNNKELVLWQELKKYE